MALNIEMFVICIIITQIHLVWFLLKDSYVFQRTEATSSYHYIISKNGSDYSDDGGGDSSDEL